MRKLSDGLASFWAARSAGTELTVARLWPAWERLFGPEIAALARPLGRRKATLVVGVEDGLVMQELSYFGPEMLDKANEFLCRKVFDKVSFELISGRASLDEVAPPPPPPRPAPRRPDELGALDLPADSPVARCYKKYVTLYQE